MKKGYSSRFVQQTPRFWELLIGIDNYEGHVLNDILLFRVHPTLLRLQQRNVFKRMAFIVVDTY